MDQSFQSDRQLSDDAVPSQRGDDRDSLLLTAVLRRAGEVGGRQVRVRNLSAGGMMAENAPVLPVGTAVAAELRGVGEVRGTVAWVAEGRMGIAFDAEIDPLLARKPITVPARPATATTRRVPL